MSSKYARNRFTLAILAIMALALAGCASNGYNNGYGNRGGGYGNSAACNMCGTVQSVHEEYVRGSNHSTVVGTVIGAVVGAALGNQVGKGDGRKAATVGGAVAGGAVGHEIGKRNEADQRVWRVEVKLNDGRYATVTQDSPPDVQRGDYVEVRNNRVYRR
ncbi:MAG: glycine zipper 2TM domain-containing protein [Rhodanobacteraceae bacterium]